MRRIDDERLCFYLQHQELIDEWATIKSLVPGTADVFLASLTDDIDQLASELGASAWNEVDSNNPKRFLICEQWRDEKDAPLVGIGLEWRASDVAFRFGNVPYVGVWVRDGRSNPNNLYLILQEELKELAAKHGFSGIGWCPVARRVSPPNERYWEDLEPYRDSLTEAVRESWQLFSNHVDAALSNLSK